VEETDTAAVQVRDGLFLAASRTYAEQYIEPFIREVYGLHESLSDDHDAIGGDGTKYEIKTCKVLRSTNNRKNSKSLLDRVIFENSNLPTNRLVPFSEHTTASYDANVQNVKRDHFDFLIYVLLFGDCVKVFFAEMGVIATGKLPNWSDKHGRYDALGKSGQFAVTRTTVGWHLAHTLKHTFTYEELATVFQEISDRQ